MNAITPETIGGRLQQLVSHWRTLQQRRPQRQFYRTLVRYAYHKKLDVQVYRAKLDEAKLDASRVSALCRILGDPDATEAFLREENPITYGAAVQQAREKSKAQAKADEDAVLPLEKEAKDETAIEASAVTPADMAKLARLWRSLRKLQPTTGSWQVDCGLFELHFAPAPVTADSASTETAWGHSTWTPESDQEPRKLVISIAPETAEKLDYLAARSGINRSETARELLRRGLHAFRAELTAAEAKPLTGPEAVIEFGLQRRKNPARSRPDQCRLPVVLSAAEREQLAALGAGCGLSQNAMANLLLEPDARARFVRLQTARDAVGLERQRTITPDPFPDLGKPVGEPANR